MKNTFFVILLLTSFLSGCHPNSCLLEPNITYFPQQRNVEFLPSAFPALSDDELKQDWGKELRAGNAFAREFDLYRAITAYKRALIFLPPGQYDNRRAQIEYDIVACYYFGKKYQEAVQAFEFSQRLKLVTNAFPVFRDIIIILYESYLETGQTLKATKMLDLIDIAQPEAGQELRISLALSEGELDCAALLAENTPHHEAVDTFICDYRQEIKSVKKAQTLNAILPGAGYYYVGQKKAAMTSFFINALFTAAAYQFFDRGYIAAGIITTSLEMGWYFGGINGAGLAAKEYNEGLYNSCGKEFMIRNKLFPILMIQTAF